MLDNVHKIDSWNQYRQVDESSIYFQGGAEKFLAEPKRELSTETHFIFQIFI